MNVMGYASFIWVLHQPTIQHPNVLRKLEDNLYIPFIEYLTDNVDFLKPSLIITGSFIDAYFDRTESVLNIISELFSKKDVDVVLTPYYYTSYALSTLPSIISQIRLHRDLMNSLFRKSSDILGFPYLEWYPQLTPWLKRIGINGVLLDEVNAGTVGTPIIIPWGSDKIVGIPVSTSVEDDIPYNVDNFLEYVQKYLEESSKTLVFVKDVRDLPRDGERLIKLLNELFSRIEEKGISVINVGEILNIYSTAPTTPVPFGASEKLLRDSLGRGFAGLIESNIVKPLFYRLSIIRRPFESKIPREVLELEEMDVFYEYRHSSYHRQRYLSKLSRAYRRIIPPSGQRIIRQRLGSEEIILYDTSRISTIICDRGFIISLVDVNTDFDYIASASLEDSELSIELTDEEFNIVPPHAFLEYVEDRPYVPGRDSLETIINDREGVVKFRYCSNDFYVEKSYRMFNNVVEGRYHIKFSNTFDKRLSVGFQIMLPTQNLEGDINREHAIVIGYKPETYEILEVSEMHGVWANYSWIGFFDAKSGAIMRVFLETKYGAHVDITLGSMSHKLNIYPEKPKDVSELSFRLLIKLEKLRVF